MKVARSGRRRPAPGAARRRTRRSEAGATTVEYVGIVAFVVVIVVAMIGFLTPIGGQATGVVNKALCKIGSSLGAYSGCDSADIPRYVPTSCQLSSNAKTYGGSISIVATVGGDTGYTIVRIRSRDENGNPVDKYAVTTNGSINGSYTLGTDASAELGAGGGGGEAGAGAKVTIDGNLSTGSTYTFDNLDDAKQFAEDNKAKFGLDGLIEGGPEADSTYYQLGGGATVKGSAGPASISGGGSAVLGMTSSKNGDRTFKLALTAKGAADIGIPIPDTFMQASASGDLSLTVEANVTFDKDGNLVKIGGKISGTAQAQGGVQLGKYKAEHGKHAAKAENSLEALDLPTLPVLQAGVSAEIGFTTDFLKSDGSYDAAQAAALGDALSGVISGQGLPPEAKEALSNQINNHSVITAQINDYSKDTQKYGGKVHVLFVTVGGEYHVVTTEQSVLGGWYFNPTTMGWDTNLLCEAGS
jgi:Flp pilus assembly pilin Flp